jgi:hypothetical protein
MLHAEIKSAKLYWQHFFLGKKIFLMTLMIFFTTLHLIRQI